MALRVRASSSETGTSTTSVQSSGVACSQPRPLSEPLSQTWALAASWIRALTSSHDGGREQRDAEADADQHQPLAVDAAAPGQHVEQDGGEQRAGERRQRARPTCCRVPATRPPPYPDGAGEHDDGDRAERGTLGDAEDVGAGQRVAGEGLGQRAGQAERGADQDRDQRSAAAAAPSR